MDLRFAAMTLTIAVAVLMLFGKIFAFFITGSSAILSDAVESVVHFLATSFAAYSLWYAEQAPDKRHPYGHGKIAYFSAGFEGAMIGVAALYIFALAFQALIFGNELTQLGTGMVLTGALALLNGLLGLFLVTVGRKRHSLILVANGKNVLTDMWTSFGVVLGVGVVWITGIWWLDPCIAIVVACNIAYTAFGLVRDAFRGLLDAADPVVTERLLACMNHMSSEGVISGFHQLRHRRTENILWVEVHLLMPDDMPVWDAHRRIGRLEKEIHQLFPENEVLITSHIEPCSHTAAHPGGHNGPKDAYQ